ncbi:MAG: polysaccharide deacetylase family protein [Patescibacteria group bacterium]|nr:polysaccharide deacetylase family protein [Patescibacteria group bacterium]
MKICFVSIDVESDFAENKNFEGIENLDKILSIFKKHNISATLFVTGNVLRRYAEIVKNWSKHYEIACHSFSHQFWNTLNNQQRKEELEEFSGLYRGIFTRSPKGFRAPSHLIDEEGLKLLQDNNFLYDSSVVPHYPFFKKYRGYKGRAPLFPYWPNIKDRRQKGQMEILEIPVRGQIFGIPLAGAWIARLPFSFYRFLFEIYRPSFLTINMHSWDILDTPQRKSTPAQFLRNLEETLLLLKKKSYKFLEGFQIYESISKNRQ